MVACIASSRSGSCSKSAAFAEAVPSRIQSRSPMLPPATSSPASAEHNFAGSLKWMAKLEKSGASPMAVNQPPEGRRLLCG
jgi:hypothetical protein